MHLLWFYHQWATYQYKNWMLRCRRLHPPTMKRVWILKTDLKIQLSACATTVQLFTSSECLQEGRSRPSSFSVRSRERSSSLVTLNGLPSKWWSTCRRLGVTWSRLILRSIARRASWIVLGTIDIANWSNKSCRSAWVAPATSRNGKIKHNYPLKSCKIRWLMKHRIKRKAWLQYFQVRTMNWAKG